MKRVNIKQILSNPEQKKKLMVGAIQFLQNIAGIDTTKEQAENAYDKVQMEKLEQRLDKQEEYQQEQNEN